MASRRVRCPSCTCLLQIQAPPYLQTVECPRCREVNTFHLGTPPVQPVGYGPRPPRRQPPYPMVEPPRYRSPGPPQLGYPGEPPRYRTPAPRPAPFVDDTLAPPSYGRGRLGYPPPMVDNDPPYGEDSPVYGRPMPVDEPPAGYNYGRSPARRPPPPYGPERAPAYGGYGNVPTIPPPRAALQPPLAYGKKRAVLCGVSYYGRKHELKGSVNDVKRMRYFLTDSMGFPDDCIITLTEDEMTPQGIPTRRNILGALKWLVQGCQSGDSLVFYYSGHGSRVQDFDMDELDGYDEALCPVDYETQGKIIDDEINAMIVRPLPAGAKLHAVVDSSYSGTILDLPFVCRINRGGQYMWEDQRGQSGIYKGTRGGLAISITACDDDQVAENPMALKGSLASSLTDSFIRVVENEQALTYGRLITAMHAVLHTRSAASPYANDPTQEPQLSSSDQFDIYSRKFIL